MDVLIFLFLSVLTAIWVIVRWRQYSKEDDARRESSARKKDDAYQEQKNSLDDG
ncbi:hypothetical protein [Solibaculum mannosilyticum]|uniref:hypothetical protein n=1 Tax=Solibaculum mannosilyticum TaxID=2780922 RepID=UPI0034A69E18